MKRIINILAMTILCVSALNGERIVSLAPAITEIVYELGRGDSLVGVTRFCDFPPAVDKVTRVGGLMDLNLEILIQLKPDIIILYPEIMDRVQVLKSRTRLLSVPHRNLRDLYQAISAISGALKREEKGRELILKLKKQLDAIRRKTAGRPRIKTLLIAGRNPDQLSNLTLIGKRDFLNEILEICGGINAYQGEIDYPSVSVESIISMSPLWIIEFSVFFQDIDQTRVRELWNRYPIIPAVKQGNIKIIVNPKWLRPGPRISQVARELFGLLNAHD